MYNHYFQKFEKIIEPKVIDYDGKDILISKGNKSNNSSSNNITSKNTNKETITQKIVNNNNSQSNLSKNFEEGFRNPEIIIYSKQTSESNNVQNSNLNINIPTLINDKSNLSKGGSTYVKNSQRTNFLSDVQLTNVIENSDKSVNIKTSPSNIDQITQQTRTNDLYLQTEYNNDLLNKSKSKNKSLNNINDNDYLKQIIKTEKNKNMNLRYENQELKKQIEQMDNTIKSQNEMINKLEKLRESDKRYVGKMENIIKNSNEIKSINAEYTTLHYENEKPKEAKLNSKTSNEKSWNMDQDINNQTPDEFANRLENHKKLHARYYYIEHPSEIYTFGREKFSVNINDKFQIKEVLEQLASKIEFYERFSEDIYELSTKDEQINETIHSIWKHLATFFSSIETPNDFEVYNLKEVLDEFNFINRNISEILDRKHKEYTYLLNKKQEQYLITENEVIKLRKENTNMKLDRGMDLKLQHQLECRNNLLQAKIEEIENAIKTPRKRKDFDFNNLYSIINNTKLGKNVNMYSDKTLYPKTFGGEVNQIQNTKIVDKEAKEHDNEKHFNNFRSPSQVQSSNYALAVPKNNTLNNTGLSYQQQPQQNTKRKLSLNSLNSRKKKLEFKKQNIIQQSVSKIERILDMNDPKNSEFYKKLDSQVNK